LHGLGRDDVHLAEPHQLAVHGDEAGGLDAVVVGEEDEHP
jgi:hypothetical protein